jgi:DDE superfamily endonuclease
VTVGISCASFFRVLYLCVHAINRVPELHYHFLTTDKEISEAALSYNNVSSHKVVAGCVLCVDGMLLRINTPKECESANTPAYFSGHYQDYGINVQAACDSRCRFVYASLAAPGGANNIFAFRQCTLANRIKNLPIGKYVIGDNAYVCTEHLLTPFAGDGKKIVKNDAYNFYISQC